MLGGSGIGLGLRGKVTNAITLSPGEIYVIPAGCYNINPGPYTSLQWLDPVTGIWRNTSANPGGYTRQVDCDGGNYRLANTTGCPVGAIISNSGGANYTNGIGGANGATATVNTGNSTWQTIVGGAVTTAVVTGSGGTGYLYPPIITIDAPPPGGLQATAYVTSLTAGTVPAAAIIVDNAGAGYTKAPTLYFTNDPRDTVGAGATATVVLTGTSTLTGIYPLTFGTATTTLPTLSFAAGTAAATVIMNWCVTSFTVTTGGAGFVTAMSPLQGVTVGNTIGTSVTAIQPNPLHTGIGLTFPRPARMTIVTSGSAIGSASSAGAYLEDSGFGIQLTASVALQFGGTSPPQITLGFGGVKDTSWIQPA